MSVAKCEYCGRIITKCVCPEPDEDEEMHDEFDEMTTKKQREWQEFDDY